MSTLLLLLGIAALLIAANALWPRYAPSGLATLSFFGAWVLGELAFHVMLLDLVVAAVLIHKGALQSSTGQIGAALDALALLLFGGVLAQSWASVGAVTEALRALPEVGRAEWRKLLVPIPVRDRRVRRTRNVVYHRDGKLELRLDVFSAGEPRDPLPVLLYVHGGAWIIGNKEYQGLPLIHRLTKAGFVAFSINYRLSPRATFPDHIVDVKRAIAWVRAHAAEYGGDPTRIAIAGGSAGGHLAALAALTPNRAEWQPGFESADTRVQACVPLYGVFDFTNRRAQWRNPGLRRLLEKYVFKATYEAAPQRFAEASPLHWVNGEAPPFLVVQGRLDSIVPVGEARAFVAELTAAGAACTYIEVPGGQHAFEVFPSLRSLAVVAGVERFLLHVLAPK